MTGNELRQRYLSFFEQRGHKVIPSSSLVPENDPTTLFTGSGMQPMMPYLLGAPHPEGNRIVDSQKCFRAQDIEEVGDNRHTTFFEMLGNWSFGDYFKEEQLNWFWEFLTQNIDLDPQDLYATVYAGNNELGIEADHESVEIWKRLYKEKGIIAKTARNAERDGLQDARIFYYPGSENWWSRVGDPGNMPNGEPGGPDSEVFFDFGKDLELHETSTYRDQPCHPGCSCGRFLEIGNNVFMTYIKTDLGFEPLEQNNIDFGGGFERTLAAENGDPDVFTTDLFMPIISRIEELCDITYESAASKEKHSFRVITDHIKAAVMLCGDGVVPSNKEQGYIMRRLLRRAIRYGKMIGIEGIFLRELVPSVVSIYHSVYPELSAQSTNEDSGGTELIDVIAAEEERFLKTLERGLKEIEKIDRIDGKAAFKLYETYGFPLELTQEIAEEKGQEIVGQEFKRAFDRHREVSRSSSAGRFKGGLQDNSEFTTRYHTATHLLHAALRKVLGNHVLQKGSNINETRLRFDFSHSESMTEGQKNEVNDLVTAWIKENLPVAKKIVSKEEALSSGALAAFKDKYPDQVSVYGIGVESENQWISREICGGPHVKSTGEIGKIKITKENAVGAGTRRIYMEFV